MSDILVVDDDPALCKALHTRLERQGYSAIMANSAAEAIRAFERERPRLVFLDVMMPDENGFIVCDYIRSQDPANEVQVVFISGASTPSHDYVQRCARSVGATAFVRKPYEYPQIAELVRQAIGPSQQVAC